MSMPGTAPAVTIREALPDDAPAMAVVVEAAYRGEGGWTTEAHLVEGARSSADDVAAYIADPAHLVLVATRADETWDGRAEAGAERVVGCCYVHRAEGERPSEFGLFAVDPRIQGGGIGARLLDEARARLRAEGTALLMIQVLQSRPELRAWYERRGFRPTGEVLAFPGSGLRVEGLGMDVLVVEP